MTRRVDLNADVGEGVGDDGALMPWLTSANIACGVHAGDAATMRATVDLACRHGVAVGAHPSLDDRQGFGRRELPVTPQEVETLVARQIEALAAVASSAGTRLIHVKPHGALYNMAARDAALAEAIARATAAVDPVLILFGLAGSQMIEAGRAAGLRTAAEGFADRAYQADGSLAPRSRADAVIHAAAAVVSRALEMIQQRRVVAVDGTVVSLDIDTLCVHGDTPGAVDLAVRLRTALVAAGVTVESVAPVDR